MNGIGKDNGINQVLRIALLFLVLAWCFYILKPFMLILVWALILGVALYPVYKKLLKRFGKRKKLGTLIFAIGVLALLLVPTYFILGTVFESTKELIQQIRDNSLQIPLPEEGVKSWPLIGEDLYREWIALAENVKVYTAEHREGLLNFSKNLVSGLTGFLATILVFIGSLLISFAFMFHAESVYKSAVQLFEKLVGKDGEEMVIMSRDTIRSVVKGILLVAFIQAILAFIGFKAIGLPAAGIFTLLILVTAIIQVPAILTMIPAILIAFSMAEPTFAILFAVYSVAVALSDNVLKPMLLGKGLNTPMIIILLGSLGGMLLHGIIGLFVGAVVLALAHRLYTYWVQQKSA
ncbi:AI-2E family transporter [Flavobacteriaceae bacterium D16]|nr:AI-2E family transporter [Flavobacteriaceae bacterium D16]